MLCSDNLTTSSAFWRKHGYSVAPLTKEHWGIKKFSWASHHVDGEYESPDYMMTPIPYPHSVDTLSPDKRKKGSMSLDSSILKHESIPENH
jgi:hypothetical protein